MLFCQNRFSWHRLQEPRNVSWYVFPSINDTENGSPPHCSLWKDLCLVQEGENQTGKTKGQELLQILLNLSGSACSPNSCGQRKTPIGNPLKIPVKLRDAKMNPCMFQGSPLFPRDRDLCSFPTGVHHST